MGPGQQAKGLVQYLLLQTLDGYIAERDGGLAWINRPGESTFEGAVPHDGSFERFVSGLGALATGSKTYEAIVNEGHEHWPYGNVPSWVFSSRELAQPWADADIRFVAGPVRPVLDQMRATAGERNIWLLGGGELAMQFADEELIDELHLGIAPTVLGGGIPTFPRRLHQRLILADARAMVNGTVDLRYIFERSGGDRTQGQSDEESS